jgi:hypothetical protein
VANFEFPGVGVLLGNGDGTFQAAVFYFSGGAYSVAVADVNGEAFSAAGRCSPGPTVILFEERKR